jgi:MoaA/NifB/PqqE/SkfB family radical SAM enzyme
MGIYFQKKRENLDLILRTVGLAPGGSPAVGDGSFQGKPLLLWLESTARCNLRCTKCGHGYDQPGSARTLPRNLSDAVVDEADEYFAAAVKVRTSGYGEMFLFSRLKSLVERIKKYECWVEGTTNGVVIDRSEIDWVVELGYDQLVFSIDGAEASTMQRLRGANLDRIWDILRYIKEKKEQWNSSKPNIVVGFVAQADNLHELPALVRKLSEFNICFLAVNTLHYKKYVPGTEDKYGKLYHDFSLANLDRSRVEELIGEGRALAEQYGIPCGVYIDLDRVYRDAADDSDLSDAADDDRELNTGELITISPVAEPAPAPESLPKLQPYYCVYPWSSLYVTARGSTSVCCSMQGDVGTVLNSGDIDRVWNGAPLRSIRQMIAKGEVHPSCAYCVTRNRHLSSFVDLEAVKSALVLQQDPEIPVAASPAATPAQPIFGYFDAPEVQGRSLEPVRITGWIASGRHGAPVREVKLRLQGQELVTVLKFHARPDVASYYGRKDLLHSGWQVTVNLPRLSPGQYELTAEAMDPDGAAGALGPLLVRIVE